MSFITTGYVLISLGALASMLVSAAPMPEADSSVQYANGVAAQKLNAEFASLSANESCTGMCIPNYAEQINDIDF